MVSKMTLNSGNLEGQLLVLCDGSPKADECTYNENTDLNCPGGVENASGHDSPMLGKCSRIDAGELESLEVVTICDHLVGGQSCGPNDRRHMQTAGRLLSALCSIRH